MKLFINADDAGVDPGRNQGIFESIERGVLRNVSVIVAQSGWEDAVKRIQGLKDKKSRKIGVGLHFNLTNGAALVKGNKTLARSDGSFFSKTEIYQKSLAGQIDTRQVVRELKAQLEMLRKCGIEPTHMDGHNHVHLLPGVREALAQVIPEGMWVRVPWEHSEPFPKSQVGSGALLSNSPGTFLRFFNYLSKPAMETWKRRFRYVDDFSGTKVTWDVTLTNFERAIRDLKGNTCEFMCHPGGDPDELSGPFSRLIERRLERDVLTDEKFKKFLEAMGAESVSFDPPKS